MHRRACLQLLATALAGFSGRTNAQPSHTVPRVGALYTGAASLAYSEMLKALAGLGFRDGANVVFEARSSGSNPDALAGLAAELLAAKVDLLFTVGPAATGAAAAATRTVPIIAFDLESDPVRRQWVQSLARPGGNLTGFFMDLPALAGKWLELVREAAPAVRRATVLWDATTGTAQVEAARAAAKRFSIAIEVAKVRSGAELTALLEGGRPLGSEALVVLSSPLIFNNLARIAEHAARHKLPSIAPYRPYAAAGGLFSYGPDVPAFARLAAGYVEKILKGGAPRDLPVQLPTRFELVVNAKAARALGIALPTSVTLRADAMVE